MHAQESQDLTVLATPLYCTVMGTRSKENSSIVGKTFDKCSSGESLVDGKT